MPFAAHWFGILFLGLLTTTAWGQETVPQAGIRLYDDGEASYKEGDFTAAAQRFEEFLKTYPASVRAPNAHYRLGQCYYKLKDLDRARKQFEIGTTFESSKIQRYSHYYLGQIERGLSHFKEAAEAFTRAYDPAGDAGFAQHVMTLIAESHFDQGRFFESTQWYLKYLQGSQNYDEAGEIRSRVDLMITQKLNPKELRGIVELKPVYPFDAMAALALARALRAESEFVEARSLLETLADRQDDYGQEARKLLGEIKTVLGKGKWKIGCLLPLTGKPSIYGQRARRGIELALDTLSSEIKDVDVDCQDTKGDPEAAAALFKAFSANEKVLSVIGPLLSKTAAAVGPLADSAKLPIMLMAPREGLPDLGEYAFRHALTASAQVRALVTYAMQNLGLKRFAILFPLEPYGTDMESLFKAELAAQGGVLVSEAAYEPKSTDFKAPIEKIKAEAFPDLPEDAPPPERTGLFVPDYYDSVGLLAPQLAFYEIKTAQLLGPSGWNYPQLVKIAGEHVDGAVFVDVFFAETEYEKARNVATLFEQKYGQPLGDIESLAYDTAALVLNTVGGIPQLSRNKVKDALLDVKDFPGVTGPMTVLPNGEVQKSLNLLTIRRGRIAKLN
ncbi:MAG: ABC transporter substrate-binding protein [Nitrospirae bacterium]|nr:ABC transporter substrate-binding protein [Nitrospirota bacterium]